MTGWFLTLDIGTTSVKAAAITDDGRDVASARAGYATSRPAPGHVEHDPEAWWRAVVEAVGRLLARGAAPASRLRGIGLSGMAATHVLLDREGRVLRPAILWQDVRAVAEAEEIVAQLGVDGVRAAFGADMPLTASAQAARMLWLARHEPGVWERTDTLLGAKDFVAYRLTGERTTDPTSVSGFASLVDGRLDPGMARATQTDPALIPRVVPPHGIAGTVLPRVAESLGLRSGLPVVSGMMDSWCAMLGSGVRAPGDAFDTAGTAEVVGLAASPRPRTTDATISRLPFLTGADVVYGVTQCGTDALTWFAELRGPLAEGDFERWGALAASVPPGSDGLVFLPYLEGERAPFSDARARGAFVGLQRRHREAHLVRAVLEGVACSVRHVLEASETEAGARAPQVVAAGGGAKSALWNQIKADVLGRPVATPHVLDAGSVGAAVLARAGVEGLSPDAALEGMVRIAAVYEPEGARVALYDTRYGRYLEAGAALRGLHARLADDASQIGST